MARAYASAIIKAPIETVWGLIRDFNGLPSWVPAVTDSKIEGGRDSDVVGCIRVIHTVSGTLVRERLLMLDDARHTFTYNFETPAFPVRNYIATVRLMPVTHSDQTFAEWEATFDEGPGDEGKYEKIISKTVFADGWKALNAKIKKEKPQMPAGEGFQAFGAQLGDDVPAPIGRVQRLDGRVAAQRTHHCTGLVALHRDRHQRGDAVAFGLRLQAHGVADDRAAGLELVDAVLHRAAGHTQSLRERRDGGARIGPQQGQQLAVGVVHARASFAQIVSILCHFA